MNAFVLPAIGDLREVLTVFGQKHPEIVRVELFGSVARGEDTPESDVDLVVSFTPNGAPRGMAGYTFLDDMEKEIAVRLRRPVHLVEQEAVENARRIGNHSLPRALARDGHLLYEAESTAN